MRMGGLCFAMLLLASACSAGANEGASPPSDSTENSTEASTEDVNIDASDGDVIAPEPGVHHLFSSGVHVGAFGPEGWIPTASGNPEPPAGLEIIGVSSDVGAPLTVSSNLASNSDPCLAVLDLGAGATGLDWELFPRFAVPVVASDEHRGAIEEALIADGLDSPDVSVREALRVDLEGDGVDEVIIEATLGGEPFFASAVGDYSIVLLRQVDAEGVVANIPLAVISTSQAEADEAGIDDLVTDLPAVFKVHHSVTDVVDLNGDGVFEIVLATQGDHSFWLSVFDPVVGFGSPVLESGCSW